MVVWVSGLWALEDVLALAVAVVAVVAAAVVAAAAAVNYSRIGMIRTGTSRNRHVSA